jgi:hypothetical protein
MPADQIEYVTPKLYKLLQIAAIIEAFLQTVHLFNHMDIYIYWKNNVYKKRKLKNNQNLEQAV